MVCLYLVVDLKKSLCIFSALRCGMQHENSEHSDAFERVRRDATKHKHQQVTSPIECVRRLKWKSHSRRMT